jgi:hypothetical protein
MVAVTKFHASRPRKDFTPSYRAALKSPVQRCYAASCELSWLAWDSLFVLQRCTIFPWPWSMQFGDGYYSAINSALEAQLRLFIRMINLLLCVCGDYNGLKVYWRQERPEVFHNKTNGNTSLLSNQLMLAWPSYNKDTSRVRQKILLFSLLSLLMSWWSFVDKYRLRCKDPFTIIVFDTVIYSRPIWHLV